MAIRTFTGSSFTEEFLVNLLCETHAVDDPELAVTVAKTGGYIHHLFPFGTERRAVCFQIIEETFKDGRVHMRELHGLAGGEVDRFQSHNGRQSPPLLSSGQG